MLKKLSVTIGILCSTSAMGQTVGVQDYVTAIKGGHGYPQCLQVQTANGGGDGATHTWRPCSSVNPPSPGTALCLGLGTGVAGAAVTQNNGFVPPELAGINGVGPVVGTSILSNLNASRWGGGVAGPWVTFVVQPTGFYGDCPSNYFGLDQVSE